MSPSQVRSELQRLQQKQRQAINNYNQQVRKVNQAINNYNRAVRAHNSRVRANRQRLQSELARLNARPRSVRYVTYQASVRTLEQSFSHVVEASEQERWYASDDLFEMAEREAANSVATLNALLDTPTTDVLDDPRLRQTVITTELQEISQDLHLRWRGALFSLNPQNADAARHFCTSTREILVGMLNLKAPDSDVLQFNPNIELKNGQVPRREKIYYCLARSGEQDPVLATFIDDDINNVMDLFSDLNPATHGEAGRYDMTQLQAIKVRVEGAIQFLHRIMSF